MQKWSAQQRWRIAAARAVGSGHRTGRARGRAARRGGFDFEKFSPRPNRFFSDLIRAAF